MAKSKEEINLLRGSLESEGVTKEVILQTWEKIKKYKEAEYSIMAIMYFLSSEDPKHSFSLTKEHHHGFVVTIS